MGNNLTTLTDAIAARINPQQLAPAQGPAQAPAPGQALPLDNLKLEAQKIKDFSGNFAEWQKWKSRTECAFNGSGYSEILSDPDYAYANPRHNSIVYSQLAAATVDGNAHHLVKEFEATQDGWGAWNNLCDWYDGDVVQHETADELRSKLEQLRLHTGTSATQYLNQFLTWHSDMAKIPGEALSPSHGVYLFLKNITDPDYKATVQFCRNNNADLRECVSAVRKTERDLLRQRSERRKLRSQARRLLQEDGGPDNNNDDVDEEDSSSKSSRKSRKRKKRKPTADNSPKRLKGTITTNDKGIIWFPTGKWFGLNEEEKTFIQKWNAAIKHGEDTKDIKLDGVTIENKARRVDSRKVSGPKGKKRITFNLDDNDDEGEDLK